MKRIFTCLCASIVICLSVPRAVAAPPNCERLEQQRAAIYNQLRKGHSVARARQLKERLREIRRRIASNCH